MNREAQQWISQVVGMEEAESHVVEEETTEWNNEHATNGEINGDSAVTDSVNGEINGTTVNGKTEGPVHATNGHASACAAISDEVNGEEVVMGNTNDGLNGGTVNGEMEVPVDATNGATDCDATVSGDNVDGEEAEVVGSTNGESMSETVNGEMEVEPVQEIQEEQETYTTTEYKTREEAVAARQSYTYGTIPRVLGGGMGEQSPLWMRDYSSPGNLPPRDPVRAQNMIDECLQLLDCDRMVKIGRAHV